MTSPASLFAPEAGWLAFQLFYHENRDRALRDFIAPSLVDLWRQGLIDSFFFVRYALGGPHLRLRVRVCPDQSEEVAAILERAAALFLARHPSTATWSEDRILKQNQSLLANDGEEEDCGVRPDNAFFRVPVRFEVERYGGPSLLGASLDFFALSSLFALRFLALHAETSPARRLPIMLRILARQAFGLATDGDDLVDLLTYASRFGSPLASFSLRGDQVYETQQKAFHTLIIKEAGTLVQDPSLETIAARHLRRAVANADATICRRITRSQMHMTANRLGLLNPEEVYLNRLLWRSIQDLADRAPGLWSDLCAFLNSKTASVENYGDEIELNDLLTHAMASCPSTLFLRRSLANA
jgi:hypothetical protein